MINEQYKKMLEGKSVIRQLSEFATARGKEIGYENVFDYRLRHTADRMCNRSYIVR